jgi:hypothetical protein
LRLSRTACQMMQRFRASCCPRTVGRRTGAHKPEMVACARCPVQITARPVRQCRVKGVRQTVVIVIASQPARVVCQSVSCGRVHIQPTMKSTSLSSSIAAIWVCNLSLDFPVHFESVSCNWCVAGNNSRQWMLQ